MKCVSLTRPGAAAGPLTLALFTMLCVSALSGESFPEPGNSQEETIPFTTPEQALKSIQLPPGFRATLFAAEPHVRQPIGMTTDARGRLWVVENYTYAELPLRFDTRYRDRIVILEDTNGDGQADERKVFWDQGLKMTSVAVGFGGVFALCPPQLLFIPDADGDDRPDGPPRVLLDGFEAGGIHHNIANGLKLGPDGWIYGRHGIQGTSMVGKPGAPEIARIPVNCSIWRFHPQTHVFEVVARGGTNPWGHDWDDHGQLFFINTVIGHLWHAIPGAYYKRMYGEHLNPYLYELIDQTADHVHWDAAERWDDIRKGTTSSTSSKGGGHAHSGLMMYLGDNWPAESRDRMFAINFHGRRLNQDRIERHGATYTGRHEPDLFQIGDPWFRGIDLMYGPDGGVYLSDWSDIGECHDVDGVHRGSGRIYKITYGEARRNGPADLRKLKNAELVNLQLHQNDWYVRQARQVLQERAARDGEPMEEVHRQLRRMFDLNEDVTRQLRALWTLYVTGGASEDWLSERLAHPSEHVRVWAIQLLTDQDSPSPALISRFTRMAEEDESGLVLTFLASTLQKISPGERFALAHALAQRSEFAADPVFPLMVWYGIELAVPQEGEKAARLAAESKLPRLARFVSRRIAEESENNSEAFDALVATLGSSSVPSLEILTGMNTALQGFGKISRPDAWTAASRRLSDHPDESVRKLERELAVLFGEGRAVDELRAVVLNKAAPHSARRRALQALVGSRVDNLVPILEAALAEAELAPDAARGLGLLGDPESPAILLRAFHKANPPARQEIMNALSSRPAFAAALLDAVESEKVPKQAVGRFQLRQMGSFHDEALQARLHALWPDTREVSGDNREQFQRFEQLLTPVTLASADLVRGRELYTQACGACHVLFGEGGRIGPDLTGSDRRNMTYLLDNILNPSAVVPPDYRVSVITLKDGRILNGVVMGRTDRALRVQTVNETLTLERSEIESIVESELSMMPEGLLEGLEDDQIRDLIAYLQSER